MDKLRMLSFFAGVGGIELGFEQTGRFETIYANEFNPYAIMTYEANFKIIVDSRDIKLIDPAELPDCDVIIGGFPCQAFSIAGYRQGFNDKKGRGNLFFEMCRFIEAKKPGIVFLENVKNLVGHDDGKTFRVILDTLEAMGYKVKYQVMNAKEFGNIPHGRERIYIVAFRDPNVYRNFEFPKPIELSKKLNDLIDFSAEVDGSFYYTPQNCYFYNDLKKNMTKKKTIYQWRRVYVRENKSNVCPTLTANMGTGGHNVPIVLTEDGKIRKLTPKECFNLQGFPKKYKLPSITNTHLYMQAGNSVVVPVIKRVAECIVEALDSTTE